jgi:hypothetical protein
MPPCWKAQYSVGKDHVRHWFDAFAQLHAFEFEASGSTGVVRSLFWRSRFIEQDTFVEANRTQSYTTVGVGTPPRPGPLPALGGTTTPGGSNYSGLLPVSSDNNNVNLMRLGHRYFATTDRDVLVEWEAEQLGTVGDPHAFAFHDELSPREKFGNVVSQSAAHSQFDAATGVHYNYVQNPVPALYGGAVTHEFYEITPNTTHLDSVSRVLLSTLKSKRASFAHSLGLTGSPNPSPPHVFPSPQPAPDHKRNPKGEL